MKNHTQQQTFHIGFLHKTELESWHFYYRLKLIVFFSVKKQITISNTVIKTQGKFYLCFTNSNYKFFSTVPTLPSISSTGPSSNTIKLFL